MTQLTELLGRMQARDPHVREALEQADATHRGPRGNYPNAARRVR